MIGVSKLSSHYHRIGQHVGGPREVFPLSVRIFHSVLVICVAALLYNIPLNLFVGLPLVALASTITLVVVALLYYFSRYRKFTAISRLIFCLAGTCLFVVNFFLNSGIDGPTSYFFVMMLVIMVAIVPVDEYKYWVGSNILLLFGLHYIQYHYPDQIPYTYPAKADRYIDISSAYATVAVIILVCFYIIRRRYDTERLEAQHTAERLLQLNAEKNKLFSIISHDLRSPLSLIQTYLEMLVEYELSEEERRDIKVQLLQSTRGTLDMVNNVLHWSTSQMSGGSVKKEMLVVGELLETQVQLFRAIALRKEIVLESVFAKETVIWGSADMIQLIIRNLLNNAIKFTSSGGRILLSASCNDQTCLMTVKDSGNGKSVKLTDDIFQLSSGTEKGTANESGVGLGLVLCREYAGLLNGKIWFSCDPNTGTTFFVELPAHP